MSTRSEMIDSLYQQAHELETLETIDNILRAIVEMETREEDFQRIEETAKNLHPIVPRHMTRHFENWGLCSEFRKDIKNMLIKELDLVYIQGYLPEEESLRLKLQNLIALDRVTPETHLAKTHAIETSV